MNIEQRTLGNLQVLSLSGRVDGYALAAMETSFIRAISVGNPPRLIFNMEQVDFMDSAALAFFLKIEKRCSASDGQLILVGIRPQVLQIFRLTNLENHFIICDTEHRAMLLMQNLKQKAGWSRAY